MVYAVQFLSPLLTLFFLVCLTANSGEQPDQFGEEKQRAGEPNGKTHPDLSAGGGEHCVEAVVSMLAWLLLLLLLSLESSTGWKPRGSFTFF